MQKTITAASLLSIGALMATPAAAVTTFSSNFDSTTFASGSHVIAAGATYEGWTAGSLGIEIQTGGVHGAPKSGSNLVELDTSGNSSMFRTIDPGIYTLTFSYSARPGASAATDGVGLYLGNSLLRSASGTGFARDGVTPKANTSWLTFTSTFTVIQATTLKFAALGTSDGIGGFIDNVKLDGAALPVPEPGEWAMLLAGLGVAGVVGSRRRTR